MALQGSFFRSTPGVTAGQHDYVGPPDKKGLCRLSKLMLRRTSRRCFNIRRHAFPSAQSQHRDFRRAEGQPTCHCKEKNGLDAQGQIPTVAEREQRAKETVSWMKFESILRWSSKKLSLFPCISRRNGLILTLECCRCQAEARQLRRGQGIDFAKETHWRYLIFNKEERRTARSFEALPRLLLNAVCVRVLRRSRSMFADMERERLKTPGGRPPQRRNKSKTISK